MAGAVAAHPAARPPTSGSPQPIDAPPRPAGPPAPAGGPRRRPGAKICVGCLRTGARRERGRLCPCVSSRRPRLPTGRRAIRRTLPEQGRRQGGGRAGGRTGAWRDGAPGEAPARAPRAIASTPASRSCAAATVTPETRSGWRSSRPAGDATPRLRPLRPGCDDQPRGRAGRGREDAADRQIGHPPPVPPGRVRPAAPGEPDRQSLASGRPVRPAGTARAIPARHVDPGPEPADPGRPDDGGEGRRLGHRRLGPDADGQASRLPGRRAGGDRGVGGAGRRRLCRGPAELPPGARRPPGAAVGRDVVDQRARRDPAGGRQVPRPRGPGREPLGAHRRRRPARTVPHPPDRRRRRGRLGPRARARLPRGLGAGSTAQRPPRRSRPRVRRWAPGTATPAAFCRTASRPRTA